MFSTEFLLASSSLARRRMLENVGLRFNTVSPGLNEEKLLAGMNGLSGVEAATRLAKAKVEKVASESGKQLIVAADQLLEINNERPPKPRNVEEARHLLGKLRGKSVSLYSAAVAIGNGANWRDCQVGRVQYQHFSQELLENYLAAAPDEASGSAGAVQLEGKGIALIEKIEGDFFAILGFPLLPFLDFLRRRENKKA